jgi:hypothetical protein
MFSVKNKMDFNNLNIPPIKLPKKTELILHLLKAEIKNRKLLIGLIDLGFDTTPYTIDFRQIVLSLIGFIKPTEEEYQHYNELLDKYCEKIDIWQSGKGLNEVAYSIYSDLLIRKQNCENQK